VAATTSAEGAQAAPDAQPQAGDAEAQAADASEAAATVEAISLDEAKKLRSEAKGLRTRLKAYEDAERERADADKSAEERSAERIATLEQELQSERSARRAMALQVTTMAAARKLGFRDPDLAHRLLGEVEYDDDGKPKNVERLLADIAKQHPYLVNGTSDFGGGPRGTPPANDADMNAWLRAKTGRG